MRLDKYDNHNFTEHNTMLSAEVLSLVGQLAIDIRASWSTDHDERYHQRDLLIEKLYGYCIDWTHRDYDGRDYRDAWSYWNAPYGYTGKTYRTLDDFYDENPLFERYEDVITGDALPEKYYKRYGILSPDKLIYVKPFHPNIDFTVDTLS